MNKKARGCMGAPSYMSAQMSCQCMQYKQIDEVSAEGESWANSEIPLTSLSSFSMPCFHFII